MRLILIFVALGFFLSCNEDEEIDPRIHILGKWENIGAGNWPDIHSYQASGYIEFREDSIARYFDYATNTYSQYSKYWITDSMLFEKDTGSFGHDYSLRHSYVMRKNWMRMDFVDVLATQRTAVYQKIK